MSKKTKLKRLIERMVRRELKESLHDVQGNMYQQDDGVHFAFTDDENDLTEKAFKELAELIHPTTISWARKWEKILGDEWEDFYNYEVLERSFNDILDPS